MFVLESVALVAAVVIAAFVGARNGNRNFYPLFQSHVELFLAGVPVGLIGMLLVLPEQTETVYWYWALVIGALTGISYSFSLPRQWRYQKGTNNKQGSPPS